MSFSRLESYLQFGFVPNKCCQKALFTLETVVNYFTDRDSPVYVASLDVSKAFDRVNHFALFIKLIDLGIPLYVLNILITWHCKLMSCVQWVGALSVVFDVKSEVCQGVINLPWFFNIYFNELISRLRKSSARFAGGLGGGLNSPNLFLNPLS